MRTTFLLIASVALGAFPIANATAQSTTRIETKPSYGAIVTIENGVKVYRVLPPHDRIIMNPEGKTPLHLGYEQVTVTERNHNYNYHYGPGYYTPTYGYGGYWGPPYGYGGFWGYGRDRKGRNRGFGRPGRHGYKNRGFGHRGGRSARGFGRGAGGHKGGRR